MKKTEITAETTVRMLDPLSEKMLKIEFMRKIITIPVININALMDA